MVVAAAVVADMLTMTAVVLPVAVVAVTAMVGETMDGRNRITGPTAALVGAVPLVAVLVTIVPAPWPVITTVTAPTVVMIPSLCPFGSAPFVGYPLAAMPG